MWQTIDWILCKKHAFFPLAKGKLATENPPSYYPKPNYYHFEQNDESVSQHAMRESLYRLLLLFLFLFFFFFFFVFLLLLLLLLHLLLLLIKLYKGRIFNWSVDLVFWLAYILSAVLFHIILLDTKRSHTILNTYRYELFIHESRHFIPTLMPGPGSLHLIHP